MYHCNKCNKEHNYEVSPFDLKCALNPMLAVKETWDEEDNKAPIGFCECGGEIEPGFPKSHLLDNSEPSEIGIEADYLKPKATIKNIKYVCNCGYVADEQHPADFKWNQECSECGCHIGRYRICYLENEKLKTYSEKCNICFNDNERLSWALGCDENQLPEMMKRHPGAEFRKAPSGGYQMVIKNRTEKKLRMKQAQMEEYG